jgi:hypothetical protein
MTKELFNGLPKTQTTPTTPTETPAPAPAPMAAAAEAPKAPETPVAPEQPSELDMLKQRARLMGIQFSNNIGVDALRAKVEAKQNGEADAPPSDPEIRQPSSAAPSIPPKSREQVLREELYAEQMRLVRCRITNLDPKKKDLPGEIFTVANEFLGNVRKFVPYGEVTDNGYHIPYCIYTALLEREFLNIRVRKTSRGQEVVEQTMAREFAIEVLPQLTPAELAKLAAAQAAAAGLD